MKATIVWSLIIVSSFGSTVYGQRPTPTTSAAPARKDEVVHLRQSTNSRFEAPLRTVAYDSTALAQLWSRSSADPSDTASVPKIDFQRSMVVVVAMGFRPSLGNRFAITGVDTTATSIRVHLKMSGPGNDCIVGQEAQYPVDIVELPRTNKLVIFDDRYVENRCKH